MNRPTSRGTRINTQVEADPRPRHRHRSRRKWLAIGLVVIAVAAGCSGSHHDASAPQAASTAGRSMTFHLAAASVTPVTAFVPDQPVGETPTSIAGVTLQVYVVKRTSPKTALVVFGLQMTPAAISAGPNLAIESGLSWNGFGSGSSTSGVGLLDTAGLKLYQPYMINPKDDATCLCSLLNDIIPSDTSAPAHMYLSAVVTAPPKSVSTVSFVTQLGTIPNVRISS